MLACSVASMEETICVQEWNLSYSFQEIRYTQNIHICSDIKLIVLLSLGKTRYIRFCGLCEVRMLVFSTVVYTLLYTPTMQWQSQPMWLKHAELRRCAPVVEVPGISPVEYRSRA